MNQRRSGHGGVDRDAHENGLARNLDLHGYVTDPKKTCDGRCSKAQGLYEHVRWPRKDALAEMLGFLKQNPLP
jgi:hypothetical protein